MRLFIALSVPVINCMFSVAVAVLPVPWCQWRRCAPCCTLYTTSPHEVGLQMLCFAVNLEVMCSVIWNQAGRTWLSNWHASYRPSDIFIFVEPCWEYIRLEQIITNFILDRIPVDDGAHSPSVPTPVLRSAEEERLQRGPQHRHHNEATSGRHSLPVLRGLGLPHGGFHSSTRTTTMEGLHSSIRINVEVLTRNSVCYIHRPYLSQH